VIRWKFCGSAFDLCSIINAKSGRCPENCKFCAQSAHYHTNAEEYPLLPASEMIALAKHNAEGGILRFSLVTSGERLTDAEVNEVCDRVREIKKSAEISVCVSLGLLSEDQFHRLRQAGVERVHNNLETSRRFFPQVCTTHKYDDKIAVLKAAQNAGSAFAAAALSASARRWRTASTWRWKSVLSAYAPCRSTC
jgi:biotin synthase